jgi:hypothetical protein
MERIVRLSSCSCGRVQCEGVGRPIVSAVCYCSDCQAGGHQIEALPDAPLVLDPDGGTPYLTYRNDRFACVSGAELLTGYKLHDKAPTRRFVASCCNSGMYLQFGPGFWISSYRRRFAEPLPPIEMRNKIERRHSDLPLSQDAPAYRGYPARLFGRLIKARLAMLIGR